MENIVAVAGLMSALMLIGFAAFGHDAVAEQHRAQVAAARQEIKVWLAARRGDYR